MLQIFVLDYFPYSAKNGVFTYVHQLTKYLMESHSISHQFNHIWIDKKMKGDFKREEKDGIPLFYLSEDVAVPDVSPNWV